MQTYFKNIYQGVKSLVIGMKVTWKHFYQKKDLVATMQYPHETWPIPEKNIGFEENDYNLIRSRLHVDIDDCIGCLQCERACPVDCIKIESIKPPKGSDFDCGITSNDTKKKMIVSRFTIDMAECCYCNLCAYPCPEECIYMVGGPNSHKHEMDYEFGKYERDGLLYEFANVSEEDIIAVGGEKYLEKKKNRENELQNALELVELAAEKAQQDLDKSKEQDKIDSVEKTDTSIFEGGMPKYNFAPLNGITQKAARGVAKRTFVFGYRKNKTPEETINLIKEFLNKDGLYSPDYDQYIDAIKNLPLVGSLKEQEAEVTIKQESAAEKTIKLDSTAVVKQNLDIKILSDLEDKMARGVAKKAFMSAKREKLDADGYVSKIEAALIEAGLSSDANSKIVKKLVGNTTSVATVKSIDEAQTLPKSSLDKIEAALSEAGLSSDANSELIKKLLENQVSEKVVPTTKEEKVLVSKPNLDIKILSDLEDKMARGVAKKAFMSAKREKLDADGYVSKIEAALSEAGLSSDANSTIVKKLLGDQVSEKVLPDTKEEKVLVSKPNLDIKILSDLEDKMARGVAKKAFMSAKREKLDADGYVSKIEAALSEAGLSSDPNTEIVNKLKG